MSTARNLRRAGAIAATVLLLATSTPLSLVNPSGVLADSWVVTSLADDGSEGTLRYAIENSAEGDTITFASGLNGTIYLDTLMDGLVIDHPLTIQGPGANAIRVDGGGEVRVLTIAVGDVMDVGDAEDMLNSFFGTGGVESVDAFMQMEPSQALGFDAAVVISGLTFRNGAVFSEEELLDGVGGNVMVLGSSAVLRNCLMEQGSAMGGGGIAVGLSLVSLEGCTIRNNTAGGLSLGAGFSGGGGGLLTAVAYVAADDCVFEGNVAQDSEDGPGLGGGITMLFSVGNFTRCDIRDNIAGDGDIGGLGGGVLTLFNLLLAMQECSISGNAAGSDGGQGAGGGMFIGPSLLATILSDSLIANNSAGSEGSLMAAGGGIAAATTPMYIPDMYQGFNIPEPEPGQPSLLPLHLVNCTVSGNSALGSEFGMGGGLWIVDEMYAGLSFCTVTNNTAGMGGGIATVMPALGNEPGQSPFGYVLLKNSIVAGNSSLDEETSNDILGPVESLYGNMIEDPDSWGYIEAEPSKRECGDLIGVDPLLGPLADNGGPTLTHALRPGSPALDAACDGYAITEYVIPWDEVVFVLGAGSGPGIGEEFPVETDQRGMPRPIDGDGDGEERCDIGAFEAAPDISLPGVVGDSAGAAITRVGECTQLRVLVANEGDAILVIDRIEVSGRSAGDFTIVGNPAGQKVLPGRSTEITLRFCPGSAGNRTATLIIYSNDPFEDPLQVTLTGTGLAAKREDTPDPASMSMSYLLIDPAQVLPGQQVVISANVCNSGEEKGSLSATLTVNGSAEQSQSVAVSGGSCKEVLFTVAKAVPVTYQVAINGMTGQFSVLAPRTVQGTVASQQHTGLGTDGLVAIIVVVLVLVGALVILFRRT